MAATMGHSPRDAAAPAGGGKTDCPIHPGDHLIHTDGKSPAEIMQEMRAIIHSGN